MIKTITKNGKIYKESEDVEGEFILLEEFKVNPQYNYYTIREEAQDKYYQEMKSEGWKWGDIQSMRQRDLPGACGSHKAREIADSINTTETVQVFYNKLLMTVKKDTHLNPPKKWLKMKINDFVYFFLHELNFYWLSKKKKTFFSILLNHYC
tara:strand:+ start:1083 stop:1538 length:456 start_codon:yes stop_codon:yes gene_type:complete